MADYYLEESFSAQCDYCGEILYDCLCETQTLTSLERTKNMADKMKVEDKKCMTPEFRVSFPAVFKPKAFKNQEPKYSVVMLFNKKTDLKELKRAYMNAGIEKWGPDQKKWPVFKNPTFRNGDEKQDVQGYPGTIFVTASSKQPPGIINQRKEDIISEQEFYAGCYARATLIAFAYGNPKEGIPYGISFSLQNLQKLRDGDKFSGRRDAADEFDEVEDGSEDASNYESGTADAGDNMGF
jgi:ssDNA-binding protein